ncbi:MAG: hypothetical protein HRS57_01905 [Mycoplasmataceae bacterium]|nr:hypothetical protein [Mycoplasmataceae bacterium]
MEIYATSKSSYGGMILSKAGELYGWGKNYSHIIDQNTGTSTVYNQLTKVSYPTSDPYVDVTYKELSVINNSSTNIVMALGNDGYLYMWGETSLIPSFEHSNPATKETPRFRVDLTDSTVSNDTTHSGKVKSFNMSRNYAALLLINEDGYLYTIGNGSSKGTAGNGCNPPSNERDKFVIIDVNCDGSYDDNDKVKYISTTDYMSNAITEDGYLYSWGADTGGAIGNGSRHQENQPYLLDINQDSIIDSNDKVVVTDNGNPNLNGGITESGELYLWGNNSASYSMLPATADGALDANNVIVPTKVNFEEYEEGEKFTTLNFWHSGGATSTDKLSIYTWGNYDFEEERVLNNLRNVDKFTVDQFITPAIAVK